MSRQGSRNMHDTMLGGSHLTEHHFTRWSADIEHAVRALPENSSCPTELYLSILQRTVESGGRVDVVERSGAPIAVVGSEHDGRLRWRNVTNWLIPGFVCASADDDVLPALARLRIELAVAWWRMPLKPVSPAIREIRETATHRIAVSEREQYWRSSKMWRTVAHARNKCSELSLSINQPGDAEWVIRSAAQKWSEPGSITANKLDVARALTENGGYASFTLRDGERLLAGSTMHIDGHTGVAGVLYRDDSIGNLPTGVRIIDAVFDYCADNSISEFDLGGGYAYKQRWAPESGSRYEIVLASYMHHQLRRATRALHVQHRSDSSGHSAA